MAFPDDDGRRSPAGCYVELRGAPASGRGSVEDAFADVRGTIRGAVSADDTVAQEILWEGTHTGPMQTPGRTLEPSGVQIRVEASVWARFDGGKAREVHHYLDVLTLVHQFGRYVRAGLTSRGSGRQLGGLDVADPIGAGVVILSKGGSVPLETLGRRAGWRSAHECKTA